MLAAPAEESERPPWNLADTFRGTLPIAVLILIGQLSRFLDQPSAQSNPKLMFWSTIFGVVVTFAVLLVPVYRIAIRRRHATLRDLGFRPFERAQSAQWIAGVIVLNLGQSYVWIYLFLRLHLRARSTLYWGSGLRGFVLAIVLGAILTGCVEELFFRGFLFVGLRRYLSFWPAAAISSLVFGLGHDLIFPQAITGILLAWLLDRTGSLWPCIIAHGAINAILISLRFALTGKV
jgi:membrane protease YdiL (CAAX protease family)